MSHGLVLQRRVAPGELRGSGHRGLLHLNDLNEYVTAMNSKKASFPELKETKRAGTADYRERCIPSKSKHHGAMDLNRIEASCLVGQEN